MGHEAVAGVILCLWLLSWAGYGDALWGTWNGDADPWRVSGCWAHGLLCYVCDVGPVTSVITDLPAH